ncbi:hypothetical protein C2E23DRAFT_136351 [Lenzites betulinus]|nr:hypothetical protein C2E23DRAFT_136351 [Lenzites betulinus]
MRPVVDSVVTDVPYHSTLLFINILDLILVTLSITTPNDQGNFVALFLQPAASILNCHFLLDLYEANARLECGGSSLSPSYSDLSLHFTGIQAQAGDAPENSSFLTSFAGSIRHPFPDSADPDTDLITDEPPAMPLVPVQTAGRPVSPGVAT